MKITIPYKSLLMNIGIGLIILAEGIFIIYPTISKIDFIKGEIQKQYIEVDRQLQLGQTTKRVTEELEKIRPFLEKLATVFLKKDDQLQFITTLESLAADHDMEITIALPDVQNSGDSDEIQKIPLALSLTGSYPNTVSFLLGLQNLEYYINITDITMSAQATAGENTAITTNIRANTYWKAL